MSDPYGEPIQVVRPLRSGEPIPDYSTLALLCGCIFGYRRQDPAKDVSRTVVYRRLRAERDFDLHCEVIKDMLKKYKSNAEIGKKLGISSDRVTDAIGLSAELRMLSRKRRAMTGSKGGIMTAQAGRHRFEKHKATILADIAATTKGQAAKKWKFDTRTLKKYLQEEAHVA